MDKVRAEGEVKGMKGKYYLEYEYLGQEHMINIMFQRSGNTTGSTYGGCTVRST